MSDADALLKRLRAPIGVPARPAVARDPVNQPMIRHWCDAMQDANPVYTEPGFAATSIHGGIVAPPAMLNAWTMLGNVPRPASEADEENTFALLDAAGYTSVVATNSEHQYPRYLRLGEEVVGVHSLSDVSAEKKTALGRGHFVTTQTEYRNQFGEPVGEMMFRMLKFKPGTGRSMPTMEPGRALPVEAAASEPHATAEPLPRPPRRETTRTIEEVSLGESLPPCGIAITATLIVAGAIASRDYQDVHHDRDLAIARGSPDIFMNILTSSGLVGRYVTDWAGPEALLRSLKIRLGAPNYPHDTMTLSGSVIETYHDEGERRVVLEIRGLNSLGEHVTASAGLDLPRTP